MRIRGLLLFALVIAACGDDEPSAPMPPGGGGPHMVGNNPPDAGGNVGEEDDAGKPDAGEGPAPNECVRIDAVQTDTDEVQVVTSTESPKDFLVTRQVGTWRDDCKQMLIELSNGVCPNGSGHELEFELSAEAIQDGQIGLGLNLLEPEPMAVPGIRVRYTRPDRFEPEGVFGNCEGSSGSISFLDAPDTTRPVTLRASYNLMLTACDDTRNPPQSVVGYFDVRVRRSQSTACPPP